jgi:hypothetical protein
MVSAARQRIGQRIGRSTRCLGAVWVLAGGACEEVPRTYSTAANARPIYSDDFQRPELGPDWNVTGPGSRLHGGALVVSGLRNHPVWLDVALPDDVRIEFDATATTEQGDIKVEIAGDGSSVATTTNYVASGYVLIFGGWNNQLNVIARKNEHGRDRVVREDPHVVPGRRYHFTVTRIGGELTWELDGETIASFVDPKPLLGAGHDHFAFSGWDAEVRFDNLEILALDAPASP